MYILDICYIVVQNRYLFDLIPYARYRYMVSIWYHVVPNHKPRYLILMFWYLLHYWQNRYLFPRRPEQASIWYDSYCQNRYVSMFGTIHNLGIVPKYQSLSISLYIHTKYLFWIKWWCSSLTSQIASWCNLVVIYLASSWNNTCV